MKRIGILSDTHGSVPEQVYSFFKDCDELWHAGDFGSMEVLEELQRFKPLVGVFGNCDDWDIRHEMPQTQLFSREGLKILMTHIGGYPKHYEPGMKALIASERPNIFVSGHSHILKVMHDPDYDLLHINLGAAGHQGFHRVSTLVRLVLDGIPKDVEIMNFDKF